MEVSDAVNIVSKLTAVDMQAATSAGDIAAALQNVRQQRNGGRVA